jgi:hypothetical protein
MHRHNGVYGAVEFQQAAITRGIRPILGTHLVFGDEEAVVLARNEKGWGALCRAATGVHWNERNERMEEWRNGGMGSQPVNSATPPFAHSAISERLAPDRTGLLLLSASIPFLERVVALSGPADLYAELRPARSAML